MGFWALSIVDPKNYFGVLGSSSSVANSLVDLVLYFFMIWIEIFPFFSFNSFSVRVCFLYCFWFLTFPWIFNSNRSSERSSIKFGDKPFKDFVRCCVIYYDHSWFCDEIDIGVWILRGISEMEKNSSNGTTRKPPPPPSPLRNSKFFQVRVLFLII